MSASELMAGFVYVIYFLALLFLFGDKRSPFNEFTSNYQWISIPIFIALGGGGFYILERASQL
jgi:hypothetical protein